MTTRRGQPEFGLYLKQTRERLGLSLRKVQDLTEGRVRNAFLSQIENGKVRLPNIDLLYDLCGVYGLDLWNLMWRAGYRIPQEEFPEDEDTVDIRDEMIYAVAIEKLQDLQLTLEELDEVLAYANFIKERGPRRIGARRRHTPAAAEASAADPTDIAKMR